MIVIKRTYLVYTGRRGNWPERISYKLFKDDDIQSMQEYLDKITVLEKRDDASNETIQIDINHI
jgi:hypothetical protein